MPDLDDDAFRSDDVDALKEEEQRKLDAIGEVQDPGALKRSQKAAPASDGRPRNLGWLLVIAGALLLFANVNGGEIWHWWWLIFLVKPLFGGGWCGARRSC